MRGSGKFERDEIARRKYSGDQSFILPIREIEVEGEGESREGSLGRKENSLHLKGEKRKQGLSIGPGTKIQKEVDKRMCIGKRGNEVEMEEQTRLDPPNMLVVGERKGVGSEKVISAKSKKDDQPGEMEIENIRNGQEPDKPKLRELSLNIISKKERTQREVGRGHTCTWKILSKGERKEAESSKDSNKENFWEGEGERETEIKGM